MGFRGMGLVLHVLLKDIFGGDIEKLTVGWSEL